MTYAEPTAPHRDSGRGAAALLIIDVVNRFDFPDSAELRTQAREIVEPILALRAQADAAQVPTIYVNDHFGEWHAEKSKLVESALEADDDFVARLAPRKQDYFIVKPQLSGFYATNLPVLLPKLGVSRLVLTGLSADMCVLFTAGDAHMRDYDLWIPADAVAASSDELHRAALRICGERFGAETRRQADLPLVEWICQSAAED